MIAPEALQSILAAAFPDAQIEVVDTTGTLDHFQVTIVAPAFAGKTLLEQHRLAQAPVVAAIEDGRVHAVSWRTYSPEQWAKRRKS